MNKDELINLVLEIVRKAKILKDKHTSELNAKVNYVCIFCKSEEEYNSLVNIVSSFGELVDDVNVYKVEAIDTISGPLRLLKIHKYEKEHPELGYADFTVKSFTSFKEKYLKKDEFNLIIRDNFEMLELIEINCDVKVCFSNLSLE